MTVTQAPATYNFSGNLPDLIVSTTDPFDFTLSQAGKTIVSENYHPSSDGRVVINLRNILEHLVESPVSINLLSLFRTIPILSENYPVVSTAFAGGTGPRYPPKRF